MKVFISQPMRDRKPDEIQAERYRIKSLIEAEEKDEVEIVESYFGGHAAKLLPLSCLADSLKLLAEADLAVFARGWDEARDCRMEHLACVEYGIPHKEL